MGGLSEIEVQIVQCKNHDERLTAPQVRKELLKVALHHHLDRAILGDGPVDYELWCPGGLTEPATRALDRWPNGWTPSALREDALEVIEGTAKFEGVRWEVVGNDVVASLLKALRPRYVTGVDISARVRKVLPVYDAFFQGRVVMDRTDVVDALRAVMSEAQGFAHLNDEDARHLVDRVKSFAPHRRLVHTSGFVLGLAPELVSRFNRKEYDSFAKYAVEGHFGIIQVVMNACSRLAQEAGRAFGEDVRPKNKNVTRVLVQTLTFSTLARTNEMILRGLNLQPGLATYESLSLTERLERHVKATWHDYQRCLEEYDPEKHAFASDEEFRARIARKAIGGARNQAEFESLLRSAIDEHRAEIETRYVHFMQLVPTEMILMTDTLSVFTNQWLMKKMADSVHLHTRLRGSPLIPE